MANYHSIKNAGILKPVANTDLGSPTNTYGNLYMSGNISLNGTSLNSTNAIAPRIASIAYVGDDTAAAPAGGSTITLTGSGFVGSSVYVGGTIAGSVSVVSSTQITFTAPAKTAGSYSLSVVNSDGATATFVPGMQYSGVPTWSTAAGSLGSVSSSGSVNFTVAATSDSTVSYSVVSGTLPSGVSLNTSTGEITGTAPVVGTSTTYNFTIRATDSENQDTDRNFSMSVTVATLVEYLVVAGGGGGGGRDAYGAFTGAGGGGAGGLLSGSASLNAGTYTITVGAGGSAGTSVSNSWSNNGGNGANSSMSGTGFTTVTSVGGGGGGAPNQQSGQNGSDGGSGGGEGDAHNYNGGNRGGRGIYPGSAYLSQARQGYDGGGTGTGGGGGSGGGGAGGVGGTCDSYGTAGNGGVGLQWPASSGTYYAGGGGGGTAYPASYATGGSGGTGGGGTGGGDTTSGTAGTTNTGGGGGAGSGTTNQNWVAHNGYAGGSGVVILRYSDSSPAASATTGSPTVTVAGGYRTYKFTGSGSITF